ncbi:oxygen-independent coproporphyrinogen-3 oxidase [Variovorax paradoxus]|uniref:Coproporphyrinogen-III oxidase n=1 Tax=Variovorax paradoxus TaxID=34073 RepID=A0AAE4C0X4_VARPD|nr:MULTISPECIES: oxygen-independent coproporphyrinogen III oxidase [Variovorax]MBD9665349.1 oxygen-independent coproporphyrinogen III oxidase [Variovorax sp. VRV01]MDP9966971.1 oxygen-independent coproporphyrinogen-3 oxidase [Variovorax paradoxus]MDR6429619.1 oxygen-independent coproporphyrinogen-3 oxidase [Variovorax paradoxus]
MTQPCTAFIEAPLAAPLSAAVLRQFDVAGPRYTSYPTADRFIEAFGADEYAAALRERRDAGTSAPPLSLYVHIPFCESLCYYCACNKVVTRHRERATQYLAYLARETRLQAAQLGRRAAVSQLHLGGGTPTFLSDAQLGELLAMLRESFDFIAGGEWSIEIDPRTVDAARLASLAALGFNRLSFGVQDFDPEVQKAVHRIQPAHQVFGLMADARALGFKSINADLIYGLPRQNDASFERTMAQVCELRPDRIALYAYAHLPERFKPQRRIAAEELPDAAARVRMLSSAIATLSDAGYVYIGMDHFALPDDPLAVAKRQGRLQRDFQGYSTQPEGDLVALGVSAIGRIGATYNQNAKTLDSYYDLLDQGRLPVVRGLALSRDDVLRRAVIMAVMCRGRVVFDAIGEAHRIDFRHYFAAEFAALGPLAAQGLVRVSDHDIEVTAQGWFVVRAIAMVFDRYCRENRTRFSRVV